MEFINEQEVQKIDCPHCKAEQRCCVDAQYISDTDLVLSFMCLACGYTSTNLNVQDSEIVKQQEEVSPELFKELRWVDPTTSLVWYPVVLNFPSFGVIFPDGTNRLDWKWRCAPAVEIPKEEREKYPIPGAPTGTYYEKRINMEKGQLFPQDKFYEACVFIGFISEQKA